MALILNQGYSNDRIYDKDKLDVSKDLMIDNSTMNKDFADNAKNLSDAAKKILGKRKPVYHWKTKNKSFLDLYNDLYHHGIKNNKFFLKLYDKDLENVDPYSPALPIELQLKILLEVMINPWYFLREICRIPEDGKPIEVGGGTAFIADRNNISSWYLFLNGIDHYDSKSRQCGKTQNAIAEFNYAYHYGCTSATFLFFNKDQPLAKQNLYRLKCQRDMMPQWMQMKIAIDEEGGINKGIDNITTMRNPITNNTIKVMPKATSKDSAIKLGRGETAACNLFDEYDFTPYNTEIVKAAVFAYSRASINAAKNGSLYGRIFTSTPGYLSTQSGKDAAKQIERMLPWKDEYYDMPINKFKKILRSKEYNGIVYNEHSWKQLKKSIDWYENQCELVDYDADTILREIDLKRIEGNELSPFKKASLVYISNHIKEPIESIDLSKNLCPINFYEKLNKKIAYIISIDPAEGLGQNNNAMVAINPYTQCIAAEFKSPYISPPDFFRMICEFMAKYCPKSMIVIEANRGRELINRFIESRYRYQLWYDAVKLTSKVVESTDKYGAQKRAANERRAFGFDTSTSTKPLLFGIIENCMEENIEKLYTTYIVKDIMSVQRKPNGKIILGAGDDSEGVGHGDNLMAYLIGLYVYFNAKNLEEFGIIKGSTSPDEVGEESDTEKIKKMKSFVNLLPDNMKEAFQSIIKEKNEVSAAWEYEKTIQQEIIKQEIASGAYQEDSRDALFQNDEVNNQQWEELERNIFESNFRNGPEGSSQQSFDVNNYI